MNKLCRFLAAIFSLLVTAGGCRSKEATQTVVEVRPDPTMRELVARVQVQAYALRADSDAVLVRDDPAAPVMWPVRRTFTPSSASSSHSFRLVLNAFDAADVLVANFTFEGEVVEGATRYVLVRLGDMCRPTKCEGGMCQALVDSEDLGNSLQEAFCHSQNDANTAANSGDGGAMTMTGVPSTGTQSGTMGAGPASSSPNTGAAASGGNTGMQTSGQGMQDAGTVVPPPPPDTTGECRDEPCGAHGSCNLKPDAPHKYVCTCETGYEFDDTTCVVRDDCKKNNGGCEGACETVVGTGEAKCSCQGNTWLKGDGKQCAELQAEEVLSYGSGSVRRTRPQVAFDGAGNGVVAWTELRDDGSHTLWTARYSADTKSWQKPVRPFLLYTTNAADLHLALGADGSGLLVWTATMDSHRQLWAARYRNNAFTAPERIDDAMGSEVLMPAIALDSAGDGLVAWTESLWPKSSLRVARYYASSDEFSRMQTALNSSGDSLVLYTSVALHSIDSGLIAWTDLPVSMPDGSVAFDLTNSAAYNVKVGTGLGQGISFGERGTSSTSPDIAMDAAGHGLAVWLRANAAGSGSYTLLSSMYVPGAGWDIAAADTLAEDVGVTSAPRIAVGADGSAFAIWRQALGTETTAKSMTRGALRIGNQFATAQDLGLPSDAAIWSDFDGMTWTPENTVTLFEQSQPHWDLAMGPGQSGFVVAAAFDTSTMPTQRELWLQRVAAEQTPARPIRFTAADSVALQPSAPRIGMNANGDGAVVWDRQVDGHYQVLVSLLQ